MYGAVMHALAVAKRTEEMEQLFSLMESGHFDDGVFPGLTCFNARMVAYTRKKAWEEVLAFHLKMQKADIPFSPISFQGVLLASFHLGNQKRAIDAMEAAVASGLKINRDLCELSLQLLIGDLAETDSIAKMRSKLRDIGEKNVRLQAASVNLSRALRMAEVEDNRQPNNGLKLQVILDRRRQAWNGALEQMVIFARTMNSNEAQSFTSQKA